MTPEREKKMRKVIGQKQPTLTVVFENIDDPHNISAVLRSCDSVGVREIYILRTQEGISAKLGKRSSASAKKWINIHTYNDVASCFKELRNKYDKIYASWLGTKTNSLYQMDLTESIALVFGNEHNGVSEETMNLCDKRFTIPQVGMIESLNISVACAVTLYEAFRQRNEKGMYNVPQLSSEESDVMYEEWKKK